MKSLGPPAANRHRLPQERAAITHHFSVGGHEGYLTVCLYPSGEPGEIFIRMVKESSTIASLMECFGTVVSVSLQHGVPLKVLCNKLSHTRFEPSGGRGTRGSATRNQSWTISFAGLSCDFRRATSCRWSTLPWVASPRTQVTFLLLRRLRSGLKIRTCPATRRRESRAAL